jgi:uncharacterized protein YdeI (YjbR/CyaY-like superfamily)
MGKKILDDLDRVEIDSVDALRRWLDAHYEQSESVWLVRYKKVIADRYVSYSDIVDAALCYGWIDSLPRKLDEARTMVLLSKRKTGSGWSAVNKAKVQRLTNSGLMHAAGLAAVERAKSDGSWDLLNDVDALIEPDDLKLALSKNVEAREGWNKLAPSMRRGLLEQIVQAKKAETRASRIIKIIEQAGAKK